MPGSRLPRASSVRALSPPTATRTEHHERDAGARQRRAEPWLRPHGRRAARAGRVPMAAGPVATLVEASTKKAVAAGGGGKAESVARSAARTWPELEPAWIRTAWAAWCGPAPAASSSFAWNLRYAPTTIAITPSEVRNRPNLRSSSPSVAHEQPRQHEHRGDGAGDQVHLRPRQRAGLVGHLHVFREELAQIEEHDESRSR